jgi:hypothetical protein
VSDFLKLREEDAPMTKQTRSMLAGVAALALIAGGGLASCSQPAEDEAATEQADATGQVADEQAEPGSEATEANAKALLKAMSDYLAAQQVISLAYDSVFEVVTGDQQKLQIATSGTIDMSRPDKIHTTRQAGFANTEMVFDGKTLSFLGKGKNAYVQAEAPGTIDELVAALRDKFHRQLPGADLLSGNVYDELMAGVTDVKDLGSGVINGKECDHLAFRTADTDWQIWIAQGAEPYPCRYVITSKGVDQAPQFTLTVREFRAGGAPGNFAFTPPAGATKMEVEDLATLRETSDLPENYRIGAEQ